VNSELISAFNAGDWDRYREIISAEFVYTEIGTDRTVRGAEEMVALCQGWRAAFPDLQGKIVSTTEAGPTVVLEIVWTGTHLGTLETPTGAFPPSGTPLQINAASISTFEDGRATLTRHYLDVHGLLSQLTAPRTSG